MKKLNKNIFKLFGFFLAIVVIAVACEQEAFEEYSSVPADAAPTVTVTIDSNTDSTLTVSYNMNVAGRVTLAVLAAGVDTPTVVTMETQDADVLMAHAVSYLEHDDGNAQGTVTYTGLMPYSQYWVVGLGHNTDGVPSEIVMTDLIRTQDFASPVISSFSPAGGADGVEIDADIVLTFSEDVSYVSGKTITLTSDIMGYNEVVDEADIAVAGNVVTISHSDFPYSDYINLEMEAGTFVDASGNGSAEYFLWPATPNYWFETKPEIDFTKLVGGFYVSSENEIGFGSGERGGYFVNIEKEDDYTLRVTNLRFDGAELFLTLNPADNSITVADQAVVYNDYYAEDVYGYDTDPYGIGAGSGYVPGSYDSETGELSFYVWYYISLGSFGMYTYDLVHVEDPSKVGSYGPGTQEEKVRNF